MTDLADKIAEFKKRQADIMALHEEFVKKSDAYGEECQARIDAIKTEFEVKKAEFGADLEKAKESYKSDLKAEFGVTDGESANILDLVGLIHRVAVK